MKLFSYILAFYLMLLSVFPCCAFDDCPEDKIDLAAQTAQPADHENGDEDCGSCSPFFSCGGCAIATVDFQPTSFEIPAFQDSPEYNSYLQTSLPRVDVDFWQPPRLS